MHVHDPYASCKEAKPDEHHQTKMANGKANGRQDRYIRMAEKSQKQEKSHDRKVAGERV